MRRSCAWLCSVLFAVTIFGCGPSRKASNEIELWHWMTDRQEALETLAGQYEEQTGIKVKLALFAPSDAYTKKIIAAAQAGVLPDIYGILDKKAIFAAFIKEGLVADLTAEFEADDNAWGKVFFAKALDNNRFKAENVEGVKPGIYGVPLDASNIQMLYNRKLLKKAGIAKPPATFHEFLAAVRALKRVGVPAFVTGFGELWIADCFALNYAFNIMGEAKVMATFRGEVPYTDADWIAVFNIFRTLAKEGAFIEGIVTKGNKYAEQDFALERAAFSFDGSWAVNVYRAMNPDLDYGVMPLPAIKRHVPMRPWGGAGSSLVINNDSPDKDKAVAFLKWLTAREQQVFLAAATNNLPANREAGAGVVPALVDFAKAMEDVTHPRVWMFNEDPLVSEAFDRGIQAIIIGERSPEAVAREVQALKVRQMKRMKDRP